MKCALVLTAFNRPGYWQEACRTWASVTSMADWDVFLRVEPTDPETESVILREFEYAMGIQDHDFEAVVNPTRLGVLLHPWVAFESLFDRGYDFVVRGEDDLLVSQDILEYFSWSADRWADVDHVASVHGWSSIPESDPYRVRLDTHFSPLTFGTWRDRWESYIGPTWDKDYSTFNGTVGNQAGWDWNLNTRVLPRMGKVVVHPGQSRVQNIGVQGTHSLPENFEQAQWRQEYGRGQYWSHD